MDIQITATTCANPALFAFVVRAELLKLFPNAKLNIRPLPAPPHRRLQTVQVEAGVSFLAELLPDILDAIRDDLASPEPVYGRG
jgi:hypothetical protein